MSKEKLNYSRKLLKYFVEKEAYLQNPPLKPSDFVKIAQSRGLSIDEKTLESLERQGLLLPILRLKRPIGKEMRIKFRKDGREYYRLKSEGLMKGEELIKEYSVRFYSSYGFNKHSLDLLKNWVSEKALYRPRETGYENWETFVGEELEFDKQQTVTFYSNFQLHLLSILLEGLAFELDLMKENPVIKTTHPLQNGVLHNRGRYEIDNLQKLTDTFTTLSKDTRWKDLFNIEEKKKNLIQQGIEFDNFLNFLLLIQSAYYPYVRSGKKNIQIHGDDEKWQKQKEDVDLDAILALTELEVRDILYWYKLFAEKASRILGGHKKDWLQLLKSIAWDKKDSLEGSIRLGIEYLQWSIMLKRVIEDITKKEVADVDELSNYSHEDLLKIELNKWGGILNPRHFRNWRNFNLSKEDHDTLNKIAKNIRENGDKKDIVPVFKTYEERGFYIDWAKKSIYLDNNKRHLMDLRKDQSKYLYYLSNDFRIDYQSRVMVFVEGETEARVLSRILHWCHDRPENAGVNFINIQGVDNWLGGKFNLREQPDRRPKEKVISNFRALITYNLNRWQIIPFLVADNEGNLLDMLGDGIIFNLNGEDIAFKKSSGLVSIWGSTNNRSLQGNNFELANFTNKEIARVLNQVIPSKIRNEENVTENNVEDIRPNKGIQHICDGKYEDQIKPKKVEIGIQLTEALLQVYEKEGNPAILERPIFAVVDKIFRNALLNYQPVDRVTELKSQEAIRKMIENS